MLYHTRVTSEDGLPRLQPRGWESKMALLQRQLDFLDRGMQDMKQKERRNFRTDMYYSRYRPLSMMGNREAVGSILASDIFWDRNGPNRNPLLTSPAVSGASREDLSADYRVINPTELREKQEPSKAVVDDKAVQAFEGHITDLGNPVEENHADYSGRPPIGESENEWEMAAKAFRQSRGLDGQITFRPVSMTTPQRSREEHRTASELLAFEDLLRQKLENADESLPNFGHKSVEEKKSDFEEEAAACTMLRKSRGFKPLKAIRLFGDGGKFSCVVLGDRGRKEDYELLVSGYCGSAGMFAFLS
ncbi:hypothetical protein Pmar_PMAR025177 [Perkinsus marinus ATCC 50983]|uniref:Uncharacterized protein n=1 Tax=Perkinsus marinus (strain ATCC 50983 / TXsc) TaxID=423536 RepID=C5KQ80_PERM5|nr:hypothetical protein Pmar_PMAR025177 [Perkinsus marinus ATCC 50983]EER13364.1 hypothetical protein Pmar_PMAR025177 [Perkinsus marinus ATCC 50983]|eukprot:XP_002781569.1 hypothetical protein Pmar_PMAR025177 [Perkinsus marinus ATCC 50983]